MVFPVRVDFSQVKAVEYWASPNQPLLSFVEAETLSLYLDEAICLTITSFESSSVNREPKWAMH